jgi:hypothetical protein
MSQTYSEDEQTTRVAVLASAGCRARRSRTHEAGIKVIFDLSPDHFESFAAYMVAHDSTLVI